MFQPDGWGIPGSGVNISAGLPFIRYKHGTECEYDDFGRVIECNNTDFEVALPAEPSAEAVLHHRWTGNPPILEMDTERYANCLEQAIEDSSR